jgi:hypothetical protein
VRSSIWLGWVAVMVVRVPLSRFRVRSLRRAMMRSPTANVRELVVVAEPGAGALVERVTGLVVAGDEDGLLDPVPLHGGGPVGDGLVEQAGRLAVDVQTPLAGKPAQVGAPTGGLVVELLEGVTLGGVALAHDGDQAVRAGAVADLAEPAAGLHRGQLPRVADRDRLGPGLLGEAEEAFGEAGGGHAGLVEQQHRPVGEGGLV